MMTDIREHSSHYAVLATWLSFGLVVFTFTRYSPELQQVVVMLTAFGYVVWGVVHHHLLRDLSGKIVIEYCMIAMLATLLLSVVLWQT